MVPKDVTYSVGWLKPIEVVGSANRGHGHGVTLGRPLVFKLAGQSFNILGDPNHYKVVAVLTDFIHVLIGQTSLQEVREIASMRGEPVPSQDESLLKWITTAFNTSGVVLLDATQEMGNFAYPYILMATYKNSSDNTTSDLIIPISDDAKYNTSEVVAYVANDICDNLMAERFILRHAVQDTMGDVDLLLSRNRQASVSSILHLIERVESGQELGIPAKLGQAAQKPPEAEEHVENQSVPIKRPHHPKDTAAPPKIVMGRGRGRGRRSRATATSLGGGFKGQQDSFK